jgi:hypothetical protein
MDHNSALLIIVSFFAGYIFKTIAFHLKIYGHTSGFVKKVTAQSLYLVGTIVHRCAVTDQAYLKALEENGKEESAKVIRNELEDNFKEWKDKLLLEFHENYPSEFKWHLKTADWNGALQMLDDIYKEKKF